MQEGCHVTTHTTHCSELVTVEYVEHLAIEHNVDA